MYVAMFGRCIREYISICATHMNTRGLSHIPIHAMRHKSVFCASVRGNLMGKVGTGRVHGQRAYQLSYNRHNEACQCQRVVVVHSPGVAWRDIAMISRSMLTRQWLQTSALPHMRTAFHRTLLFHAVSSSQYSMMNSIMAAPCAAWYSGEWLSKKAVEAVCRCEGTFTSADTTHRNTSATRTQHLQSKDRCGAFHSAVIKYSNW